MSLVTRAQVRFLWQARGSMLSALLGMTIGVASVVGVHLLSAEVALSVGQQAQPVSAVDLYLQKTELTDADYFELRARFRNGELPEVDALFPLLEGEVVLNDEPHLLVGTDPLATGGFRLGGPQLGSASGAESFAGGADRAAAGTNISAQGTKGETSGLNQSAQFFSVDSVILPRGSEPVDSVRLKGRDVRVLGYTAPGRTVLADLPSVRSILSGAQGVSAVSPRLTRIGVRFSEAAKPEALISGFVRKLFPGALSEGEVEPLSGLGEQWRQTPAANQNPTQELLRAVLFNVAALSVLALVVAWLLTYQVACHALGRRQAMFERLQSLGVSRKRLRGLTQIEGLVLGAAATLLGVGLGSVLANLLLSLALGAGFEFALGLSAFVWLKAVVSGIGVAGVSYWFAANQTLFAPPPRGSVASDSSVTWPIVLPLVLLVVFLWGLWGGTLVGAFACIVVSALTLIIYLPSLVDWLWRRTLTSAYNQQGSTLNMLALRQVLIGRELRLGVSALALALATALGISIMVDSFRGAFLQMLDQRLADDVVVQLQSPSAAANPEATQEANNKAMEKALLATTTNLYWRGTASVSIAGVSGRAEFSDTPIELLSRFFASDAAISQIFGADEASVYVNESFARLRELSVGDSIELSGNSFGAPARVAGIFTDFGEVRPRLLVSQELVKQIQPQAELKELYLRLPHEASGSAISRVRDALGDLADLPGLRLQDQAQVRARSIEIFEQTFAITRALTWLALLVAAVALANALAAHGLQQQGTARQLRVLGVGGGQARKLRYRGTLYVAGAAVALAVPLGFVIAALLCLLVNPIAFGWSFPMRLTFAGVAWPIVGGSLGALFAALLGDVLAGRRLAQTSIVGRAVPSSATAGQISVCLLLLLSGCGADPKSVQTTDNPNPSPALRVGSVLGGDSSGFARATEVVPFVFPRDHGPHEQFRSEWWYLTCPLRARGTDAEYGVQFTLFRQALVPPSTRADDVSLWRTGQIYMAHAALTDVDAQRHSEVTRLARGHPALAGVRSGAKDANLTTVASAKSAGKSASESEEVGFAAWLEDWRLDAVADPASSSNSGAATGTSAGLDRLQLQINSEKFYVSLALERDKPLVLQGDRGLSYKGSSEASYYYSLPRLTAQGSVGHKSSVGSSDRKNRLDLLDPVDVEGACWLDREWSTSVLADNLLGWDWFALQFDDATELMLFQLRAKSADKTPVSAVLTSPSSPSGPSGPSGPKSTPRLQGKRIAPDGLATTIRVRDLGFQALRYWQDETGSDWPVEWRVRVGDRTLRVVAALDDQRMRSSIAYWEGLVWVYDNERRVGQGYLEMTGYAK